MDNARHAQNKPGQFQKDWVYHDDNVSCYSWYGVYLFIFRFNECVFFVRCCSCWWDLQTYILYLNSALFVSELDCILPLPWQC